MFIQPSLSFTSQAYLTSEAEIRTSRSLSTVTRPSPKSSSSLSRGATTEFLHISSLEHLSHVTPLPRLVDTLKETYLALQGATQTRMRMGTIWAVCLQMGIVSALHLAAFDPYHPQKPRVAAGAKGDVFMTVRTKEKLNWSRGADAGRLSEAMTSPITVRVGGRKRVFQGGHASPRPCPRLEAPE